eukprot:136574_1
MSVEDDLKLWIDNRINAMEEKMLKKISELEHRLDVIERQSNVFNIQSGSNPSDYNNNDNVLQMLGLELTPESKDAGTGDKVNVLFLSLDRTRISATQSMKEKDYAGALILFRNALDSIADIELHPEYPNKDHLHSVSVCYHNRAICLGKTDQLGQALVSINKCIELQPKWFKPYSTLASLYEYYNHWPEALDAYAKAMKMCTSDENEQQKLKSRYQSLSKRMNTMKPSTSVEY